MHLSLQRLQQLASTDDAAKMYLTQQHIQGPRLYQFLDAWHEDFHQTICSSRTAVLQLLGALTTTRFIIGHRLYSMDASMAGNESPFCTLRC
jgi:hypothetical protein